MNEPNEESKKRGLVLGARVHAWNRAVAVVGFDHDGDPVLEGIGPYFASDVTLAEPAPAEEPAHDDSETVEIGACYEDDDDGEIARVTATEPDVACTIVRESENTWRARACPVGFTYAYRDAAHFRGTYTKRVADPTPAIAPAPAPLPDTPGFGCVAVDIDRKPYGDKPPMALIPWEVVPNRWRPEPVEGADPDESYLPARYVRVLLEIHGDDLLSDAARAFGHGCAKYGRDTWRASPWEADNGRGRMEYESALYRHLYADQIGEKIDPDSGLPHVAHALASALICAWHVAHALAGSK